MNSVKGTVEISSTDFSLPKGQLIVIQRNVLFLMHLKNGTIFTLISNCFSTAFVYCDP